MCFSKFLNLYLSFYCASLLIGFCGGLKEWFAPSPQTGYCYYVHDNARYQFYPSKDICTGLQAMLPQLPVTNPAQELAYWTGKADALLGISTSLTWSAGFWIGYIGANDASKGYWISIYDGHALPYSSNWHGIEATQWASQPLAFTSKWINWQFGSYVDPATEYLVCQRNNCEIGSVTGGTIAQTDTNEYTLTCNEGYKLTGLASSACTMCPNTFTHLGSCERIECPGMTIPYSQLSKVGTVYALESVTVTCNDGYTLNGPSVVDCDKDGQWSEMPSCDQRLISYRCTLDLKTDECLKTFDWFKGDYKAVCSER